MALRRKAVDLPPASPPQEVHRRSLVAAAARITNLEGRAFQAYKFGDDSWQPECWRLYDVIGELRFVANWVGSACSRVRIYVAEVEARQGKGPGYETLPKVREGPAFGLSIANRMAEILERGKASVEGRGAHGI